MHHLFKRVQRALRGLDGRPRLADREPDAGTTPSTAPHARARRRGRAARDQRLRRSRPASPCRGFAELEDDGSTACGCWIYSGVFADDVNQARRRDPGDLDAPGGWVSPEWAWAWPANRRILYTRASADPRGPAVVGAQEVHLVGRGAGAVDGLRRPGLPGRQAAGLPPAARRRGHGRDRRRRPVHHDGRRPRLAVRAERPARRPDADALRADRVAGRQPPVPGDRREPGGAALDAPGQPACHARRPALPARGDDLPADRAPHGGRRCRAGCRGWRSCSRRCSPRSTRCWPRARASRTAAG